MWNDYRLPSQNLFFDEFLFSIKETHTGEQRVTRSKSLGTPGIAVLDRTTFSKHFPGPRHD